MVEVCFLFVLLGLILVREVIDIELYPNSMFGQNTEDHNANKLLCSILLFVLFLGVPLIFLNIRSNVVPNDRMIMSNEFGKCGSGDGLVKHNIYEHLPRASYEDFTPNMGLLTI